MRWHPVPALLIAVILTACNQPFWTPPPRPEPVPEKPPASADLITSIVLTRSPCMMTCPHFQLTLRRDGSATYVGDSHVPRPGTYESKWTEGEFAELARQILRNGFFTHDRNLAAAIDARATVVSVTVADPEVRRVSIVGFFRDYHYLWALSDQLDSIAGRLDWHPVQIQ